MEKSLEEDGHVPLTSPTTTAEFEKVMINLGFDPALSSFKGEYAKLLGVLKNSLGQERRLVKKIGQLNEEIVSNAAKVTQALRLAEEDGATIEDLRKQVEKAWGMVEASSTRAEAADQTLEALSAEVEDLRGKLGKIDEALGGDTVEGLAASQSMLSARLETATKALAQEKSRADSLVVEVSTRSEKLKEKREESRELKAALARKEAEEAKVARQMAAMQADAGKAREEMLERMGELEAGRKERQDLQATIARVEKALATQRAATTSALAEVTEVTGRLHKAEGEARDAGEREATALAAKEACEKEVREVKDTLGRERKAAAKLATSLEVQGKELALAKARGDAGAVELEKFRTEVASLTKSFTAEQLRVKDRERVAERLDKEKAKALAAAAVEKGRVGEAELAVEVVEREARELKGELAVAHHDIGKLKAVVLSLQSSVTREQRRVSAAESATSEAMEASAVKSAQVVEMGEREGELTAKLRALQQSFESMRAERGKWKKEAEVLGEELKELGRKEAVVVAQVGLLKDQVMAKDKRLVSEQFELNTVTKRLNSRSAECEKLRGLLHEAGDSLKARGEELERLSSALRTADEEALAQKVAYDAIVGERDAVASALTRRNDELAMDRDTMAVMQATLAKGSKLYEAKVTENKALILKVRGSDPLLSFTLFYPSLPLPFQSFLPPSTHLPSPTTHTPRPSPLPPFQIAEMQREKQLKETASGSIPLEARRQIVGLQRDLDSEKSKVSVGVGVLVYFFLFDGNTPRPKKGRVPN